ncbi:MAG: hypothetical protein RJB39_19 [Candidatus Parcubacteria bacterium]|jgi:chromosome segregation ATPase
MFGITTPPSRQNNNSTNRITQNKLEEIRGASHSGTYDAGGAQRMEMEYLKKEKERRDKERARMEYDSKKREHDGLLASQERFQNEERRLHAELTRYETEVGHAESEEKRAIQDLPTHKKEAEDLEKKIHQMEADLLSFKNRHQRLIQDISRLEQNGKTAKMITDKKTAFVTSIREKMEIAKRNFENYKKDSDKLAQELEQLKRLI